MSATLSDSLLLIALWLCRWCVTTTAATAVAAAAAATTAATASTTAAVFLYVSAMWQGEPVSMWTRNSAWRFTPHTNPKTRSIQANGSWRGRWKHAYLTAEWQSENAKPVCARPRGGEAWAHTGRERGSKHITFGTNKHTVRQQGDARCQAAVRNGHSTRGLECEFWAIHSRRRTCCIRSRPDALLHRPVMAMP